MLAPGKNRKSSPEKDLNKGTREENQPLDRAAAERDADLLIKAGPKKWGTDEETFSMIFARRSFVQLREIILIFEKKTGTLMEKMIESETRKVVLFKENISSAFILFTRNHS